MRVADGWAPSVSDGIPSVPRRKAVIPQPFNRPSTELSLPGDQQREWRLVLAEDVQVGDTVVDVGLVLETRSRPVIGCSYLDVYWGWSCWLEESHKDDHMDWDVAKAVGRLCVPGTHWMLVGPEIEREYAPHLVVRAFQLKQLNM